MSSYNTFISSPQNSSASSDNGLNPVTGVTFNLDAVMLSVCRGEPNDREVAVLE
jgi:hypothetical protein